MKPDPARRDRSRSPPSRPHGLRMDLLATRTVTFDEFLFEEEQLALNGPDDSPLKPIPVLLAAGESMGDYERDFERWLFVRNISMNFLQGHPGVERLFRLDYTNSKFLELRRRNIAVETRPQLSDRLPVENSDEKGSSGAWKHDLGPNVRNLEVYRGLRARSELLDACVVSPDEFLKTIERYGPNGRIYLERPLRAIAIVLRPGETPAEYEEDFKRWLSTQKVTLAALEQDPEEERRFRQCFAYSRAYELKRQARQLPSSHKRPRLDVDTRVVGDAGSDAASCTSSTTISEPSLTPGDDELGDRRFPGGKLSLEITELSEDNQGRGGKTAGVEKNKSNADIYHSAALVLASSEGIDVDSAAASSVTDYVDSCAKIELNEAAMQDSLAMAGTDTAKAVECMRRVHELKEVVNQEKQRRDVSLAALVAHEWKNKSKELEQLALESADNEEAEPPHRKLVASYEKLEQNRNEILTLRIKLKNRLRWLKATDTDRDHQFNELGEISDMLAAAMSDRSLLDDERRTLYLMLLRSDERLRLLAAEAAEEAEHVWNMCD